MKLLAFAASNSSKSINKKLVNYAASLVEGVEVETLDINDYEMPIFSIDREEQIGQHQLAKDFQKKIGDADALLISFAEHNGSFTAAYKNLFDWTSRLDTKVFQDKPVVMLSTSPGPHGAATVLTAATSAAPHQGADLRAQLSVPSFSENFDLESNSISNPEINAQLISALSELTKDS
mgnify:CR=1 FL=1